MSSLTAAISRIGQLLEGARIDWVAGDTPAHAICLAALKACGIKLT